MERTIGAIEAQRDFKTVLDEVSVHGESYVVERQGAAIAAVVPMHIYEQWKHIREGFFDRLARTAERAGMTEENGMALALEAQRSARARSRQEDAE